MARTRAVCPMVREYISENIFCLNISAELVAIMFIKNG